MKKAATLSYGLYLDKEGSLLSSLGFGTVSDGLAIVVAGGFSEENPGGMLVGALGASGSQGAADAALKSTLNLLRKTTMDAADAAGGLEKTFTSDPTLTDGWDTLLQAIGSGASRGSGRGESRGRGVIRGRGGRGRGRGGGRGGGPAPAWQGVGPPPIGAVEARGDRGGWTGTAPTPERPLGVWLPGLKRVSKLLNGTAGVRHVASSKVHKKFASPPPSSPPPAAAGESLDAKMREELGLPPVDGAAPIEPAADDEYRSAEARLGGVRNRLVIRIDGMGNYGAHRLRASFETNYGLRTQELYVSCEKGFSLAELRDVLRALQPVLDFVLDDGDLLPF